jgi:SAM-dependent methyltransferase
MGTQVDLLRNYPKTKRNVTERGIDKTVADRRIARQFGKDFFDGDRRHGYGGYSYQPHIWQPVISDFKKHFQLTAHHLVLDIGCAKGFMLHDMAALIPGIDVKGLDISWYAVRNAIEDMRPNLIVGDALNLPWAAHTFDLVISINTIHNLDHAGCKRALKEIERVGKGKSFITVDAYRNKNEKALMEAWNLTAKTILHVDEWVQLFNEAGYSGDYYWFIP